MVEQITADELADRLDDDSLTLVDTRPAESFEGWHLPGAINVPHDPRAGIEEEDVERVREAAGDGPVTAICGKGLTSTPFAFDLDQRGFDVTVVKGGMQDWNTVHEVVPVVAGDESDPEGASEHLVVRQVQRRGTGCLGYVVGDVASGAAAVVDPTRQTDAFAVAAESAGLTIERVVDTHVHADHLSGGPRLADDLDVPYHLGEKARERDVACQFEPVADGDELAVGEVTLRAMHAPGHTSEMVNYVVDDELLLSSDTLFVESVGRTELEFGDEAAVEGARTLYDTIHETILALSENTLVLPGHVSVTDDGRFEYGRPGDPIAATLGEIREDLDLLGLDRDAFVERLVEDAPEKPANYEEIVELNSCRGDQPDTEDEAAGLESGPNNCAA